jgi:hypothetical protein
MLDCLIGFSAFAVGGHLQTMSTIAFERTLFRERVGLSHHHRGKETPGADRTILSRLAHLFERIVWILFVPLHSASETSNLHPDYRSQPCYLIDSILSTHLVVRVLRQAM